MRGAASPRCALAAATQWRWRSNGKLKIQTVGIIGGGTMGNGIAHVAARSGLKVILHDLEQRFLDRALSTITKNLDREVAKGKITATEKAAALSQIVPTTNPAALPDADFVIEAVVENVDIK